MNNKDKKQIEYFFSLGGEIKNIEHIKLPERAREILEDMHIKVSQHFDKSVSCLAQGSFLNNTYIISSDVDIAIYWKRESFDVQDYIAHRENIRSFLKKNFLDVAEKDKCFSLPLAYGIDVDIVPIVSVINASSKKHKKYILDIKTKRVLIDYPLVSCQMMNRKNKKTKEVYKKTLDF